MKTKVLQLGFLFIVAFFIPGNLVAQINPTFTVTPLTAKIYNPAAQKDVVVVFMVSAKDTADFPPVLCFPFKCSTFNQGQETIYNPAQENVEIILNDSNIVNNRMVYELIKDKVNLRTSNKYFIINYYLKDMTSDPIQKLEFYFALKEKRNKSARFEEKYTFDVIQ